VFFGYYLAIHGQKPGVYIGLWISCWYLWGKVCVGALNARVCYCFVPPLQSPSAKVRPGLRTRFVASRKILTRRLNWPTHLHRIASLFSGGWLPVTPTRAKPCSPEPTLIHKTGTFSHEKNISAQCPEAQAHPRIPCTYGYQGWAPGSEPSPGKGSQAPFRIKP
jgi:hypothetical protein